MVHETTFHGLDGGLISEVSLYVVDLSWGNTCLKIFDCVNVLVKKWP